MRRLVLPCISAVILWACATEDDNESADKSKDDVSDKGEAGSQSEESGSESSDDGSESSVGEAVPVRGGFAIERVAINQGVEIPIAESGSPIVPADRVANMITGRETLIRAYWSFPEDWTARRVIGRLFLRYADGREKQVETEPVLVDGESHGGNLSTVLWWGLLADQVEAGMEYSIDVIEAEPELEAVQELPDEDATQAFEGFERFGAVETPLELKVVLVPIAYETSGCTSDPTQGEDSIEAHMEELETAFYDQNPIQKVSIRIRDEVYVQTERLEGLGELLQVVMEIREEDDGDPNEYYHGVINICTSGIDGAAGLAAGGFASPTPETANLRVSVGTWWLNGLAESYRTMVHEVGHNQGLLHVACPVQSAAPDPSYPHDNGKIGDWGFAVRAQHFYSPNAAYDYMSYCTPSFVSDFTWNKTYKRIKLLTSWDLENKTEPGLGSDQSSVLQDRSGKWSVYGLVQENGVETWWIGQGLPTNDGGETEHQLSLTSVSGESGSISLDAYPLDHDAGRLFIGPVPLWLESQAEDKLQLTRQIQSIQHIDAEHGSRIVHLSPPLLGQANSL